MTKKMKNPVPATPPRLGLDYTPQGRAIGRLSYGIAPRLKAGRRQTAHMIVARRLENFEAADLTPLTGLPTCQRHDVLLPVDAPDHCWTPRGLCDHFEAQALPNQTDLFGVLTLRCAHRDSRPAFWETVRGFLKTQVVEARQLPVVMVLHVPSIAARDLQPHVHALLCLRRLPGPDFSVFDSELKGPNAKQILLDLWDAWCATMPHLQPAYQAHCRGGSQ